MRNNAMLSSIQLSSYHPSSLSSDHPSTLSFDHPSTLIFSSILPTLPSSSIFHPIAVILQNINQAIWRIQIKSILLEVILPIEQIFYTPLFKIFWSLSTTQVSVSGVAKVSVPRAGGEGLPRFGGRSDPRILVERGGAMGLRFGGRDVSMILVEGEELTEIRR